MVPHFIIRLSFLLSLVATARFVVRSRPDVSLPRAVERAVRVTINNRPQD